MARAVPQHREARRPDELRAAEAPHAPAPPVEQLLQLQRGAGNAQVSRALLARRFDRSAYQRSMAEKAAFMAKQYTKLGWHPSTGIGNFDLLFDPATGQLTITVKCKFWFEDGDPAKNVGAEPEDLRWAPDEILKWKADFLRTVSRNWSNQFTFHCTRDWWEELQATTQVRFVETDEAQAHYTLTIHKADNYTSHVNGPKPNQRQGTADLESSDVAQTENKHGSQVVADHEAGHMLGLGDEYPRKGKKKTRHSKLVRAEFGHAVARHNDGRQMSDGDLMMPEYGVTFLEGLKAATAMPQWSHAAKAPAPVLSEPVDGPAPAPPNPLAPRVSTA